MFRPSMTAFFARCRKPCTAAISKSHIRQAQSGYERMCQNNNVLDQVHRIVPAWTNPVVINGRPRETIVRVFPKGSRQPGGIAAINGWTARLWQHRLRRATISLQGAQLGAYPG